MVDATSQWKLKLLYDGKCPFCRREVEWLKRRDTKGQLAVEDISHPKFEPDRYGLRAEDVNAALHGVLPGGRVLRGMEAVREAYRVVGLGWVVAATRLPGLRWASDRLYAVFARNRVRLGGFFGRTCEGGACSIKERHSQ